jgi:hypothetical protein
VRLASQFGSAISSTFCCFSLESMFFLP